MFQEHQEIHHKFTHVKDHLIFKNLIKIKLNTVYRLINIIITDKSLTINKKKH